MDQSKCLRDEPMQPPAAINHEGLLLPGQRFSSDQQCKGNAKVFVKLRGIFISDNVSSNDTLDDTLSSSSIMYHPYEN